MQQIEVIYENGVLRPVGPMPTDVTEHQHLTVTIEEGAGPWNWGPAPSPVADLDTVRALLAKMPGTLAQAVHDEREER
jgi:hypothetical protein